MSDRVEAIEIESTDMPLRPLGEARRNPNQREREFYGLYLGDVPQAGTFVDRGAPETPAVGDPLPEFIQLPGPIPDAVKRPPRRQMEPGDPGPSTFASRKRARLAAEGITMPEPPEAQTLPRYNEGATFAERAAIRRARNAAGILDDPFATRRRDLLHQGPGEVLGAREKNRGATTIVPGEA